MASWSCIGPQMRFASAASFRSTASRPDSPLLPMERRYSLQAAIAMRRFPPSPRLATKNRKYRTSSTGTPTAQSRLLAQTTDPSRSSPTKEMTVSASSKWTRHPTERRVCRTTVACRRIMLRLDWRFRPMGKTLRHQRTRLWATAHVHKRTAGGKRCRRRRCCGRSDARTGRRRMCGRGLFARAGGGESGRPARLGHAARRWSAGGLRCRCAAPRARPRRPRHDRRWKRPRWPRAVPGRTVGVRR